MKSRDVGQSVPGGPKWKPIFFNPVYLLFIGILHLLHIVGIQLLIQRYDDDQEEISLIRSNATVQDPQSMFVFEEDDAGSFVLWFYLPVAISTILALMWEAVDVNIRRLEPFRQLASPEGGNTWNAMCLDYTGSFGFLVPFKAFTRGHYTVALSAFVFLVTTVVIPTLTGGIFEVEWGTLSYSADKTSGPKYASISVNSGIAIATQSLHGLVMGLSFVMGFVLFRRGTGLYHDPQGIGGMATLISDDFRSRSGVIPLFYQLPSYAHSSIIVGALQHVSFQLQHVSLPGGVDNGSSSTVYQLTSSALPGQPLPLGPNDKSFFHDKKDSRGFWQTKTALLLAEVLLWLGHASIIGGIYSVTKVVGSEEVADRSKVTIAKMVLTFCITVGGIMWLNVQREVSRTETWRRLGHGRARLARTYLARSDSLNLGILVGAAVSVVKGSFMTLWTTLCVLMVQVAMVFTPPLLELLYAASSTASMSGLRKEAGMLTGNQGLALAFVGIAVHLIIFFNMILLMISGRTRAYLPRAPNTIASQILYLCRSDRLLGSFVGTSMLSQKELEERMRGWSSRCLFGLFWWPRGRSWTIGVEMDGNQWAPFNFLNGINGFYPCA